MRSLSAAIALASALLAGPLLHAADHAPAELKQAQDIFVAKCAKCHTLPMPSKYKEEQWQEWMTKMAKKSHLNRQQSDLLVKYADRLGRGDQKR